MKPCIRKCPGRTVAETEFVASNRWVVRGIFGSENRCCKSSDQRLASVGYRRDVLAKKPVRQKQNTLKQKCLRLQEDTQNPALRNGRLEEFLLLLNGRLEEFFYS